MAAAVRGHFETTVEREEVAATSTVTSLKIILVYSGARRRRIESLLTNNEVTADACATPIQRASASLPDHSLLLTRKLS